MKLVKPSDGPLPSNGKRAIRSNRRPRWLLEWIENKSQYVLMQCGHKENIAIADSAIALIQTFDDVKLYCNKCKKFSAIERSIGLLEYLGLPKPQYPDTPPF